MNVRFQADNDLKKAIVKGVVRREPTVDFRTAQAALLDSVNDLEVLRLAASEGRILVSHDVTTMAGTFEQFIRSGNRSPGLFLVPQDARVSNVVESLLLICCSFGWHPTP